MDMKIRRIAVFGASMLALCTPALVAWRAEAQAPTASAGSQAPGHQRLLPLEGGRNFRDLGGYRTADGRTVKWGMLFRSGSMAGLTASDLASLDARGLRVVCDFRDHAERAAEPAPWGADAASGPTVFADDYDGMAIGLMPKDMARMTPESARAMMTASYPTMLRTFAPQYKRMFAQLLAGHAPLAFNCSAGKDRTGVAAALLLTALGVPRETVIEDYLLTNRYLPAALAASAGKGGALDGQPWSRLPPEVLGAFMKADRAYIEAAFGALDAHRGGAEGYLADEMGLGPAQIERLRALYLDRA
ncbi:tyrosine-protein phosphatase [Novosphingobium sp. RL4]|uniref:tyrosine-protein phosphatase n=1 Tax=Novosphingobium sp. RL4 TaxID=3109595 RepID=UPI002D79A51A|nr:tyrosine-protein phosphatase [Novosphingobium sp. RL4]WRT96047.1 tyrosine-protein phosphatase [Novosphingobium sp. RL4]